MYLYADFGNLHRLWCSLTMQRLDITLTYARVIDINMTQIKDRISQLPKYLVVTKSYFFDKIDAAPSGFRGSATSGSVSSDVIDKILTIFPMVNPEWLILGKGQILKTETTSPQTLEIGADNQGNLIIGQGNITPPITLHASQSDALYSFLQRQIEEKDKQIQHLTELL